MDQSDGHPSPRRKYHYLSQVKKQAKRDLIKKTNDYYGVPCSKQSPLKGFKKIVLAYNTRGLGSAYKNPL
jgi:hypothetical protein